MIENEISSNYRYENLIKQRYKTNNNNGNYDIANTYSQSKKLNSIVKKLLNEENTNKERNSFSQSLLLINGDSKIN